MLGPNSQLKTILQPVSVELQWVEEELSRQVDRLQSLRPVHNGHSRLADRAVAHLFRSRGKRLRPALVLLSARSSGVDENGRIPILIEVAAATEIVHSASLVHDDVIDEEYLRRRRRSTNAKYGNKIAVLVGDILYAQFFTMIENLTGADAETRLHLLRLFTDVTKQMCFGEINGEQLRQSAQAPTFDEYLSTLHDKTAVLVGACCQAGALISDASDAHIEALRRYGVSLGMAYQLLDDLADGDSPVSGEEQLTQSVTEFLDEAEEHLGGLPDNDATWGLRGMIQLLRTGSTVNHTVREHAAP